LAIAMLRLGIAIGRCRGPYPMEPPMRAFLPVMSLASCLVAATLAPAAESPAPPTKAQVEALLAKAQDWLLAQQQPDGAFLPGKQFVVGVTAMSVEALARPPLGLGKGDPRIAKALALLKTHRQPDGGTYAKEEGLGNYGTAFTLMALAATGADEGEWIAGGQRFLFGGQNSNADSIAEGGIGYGSKGSGHEDLSNTASAVAALKASGVPASDPHMQKALAFIQRCQNLSSHNKLPWVSNDGGAVYSPEESKAEGSWNPKEAGGGAAPSSEVKLASYGSMTYALISSYLALDLPPEDPRVAAALAWVKENYQFDVNPGMRSGKELEGLLYYYAAMAKTFDTLDLTVIELKGGKRVDWRADLFAAISKRAVPTKLDDGREGIMWINSAKRWGEGLPQLATVYLIKALKSVHASL
jgi:squalene-hopene/tetraprenyl-beta-curcumene cyclase